ncbi:MAG: hypothetical protein D8M59_00670 [Planctomycetes bacterium]|nr:hypothetical protein [Planctomycetota bacterium]NOG54765.1 hypothetical protein [Planctomycetota bacterium]
MSSDTEPQPGTGASEEPTDDQSPPQTAAGTHRPGATTRLLIVNSLSTYARLAGTFVVGLIVTPYLGLEDHLGLAGFGLFSILLSSVGILTFVQTTVRSALIRELSAAYYAEDQQVLPRRFTSAVISSFLLGLILCVGMLLLAPLAVWIIKFPEEYAGEVWWSWVVLSAEISGLVWAVPFLILFDARQKIPISNAFLLLERLCALGAAYLVFGMDVGRETPLLSFVLWYAILRTGVRLIGSLAAYVSCPRARLHLSLYDRSELGRILRTGKHVLMQEVSTNLYNRANQLLANLFLGSAANGVFGAAIQLKEYSRQVGLGLCYGIEPLAAKFAESDDGGRKHVGNLILTMTRIQAGVILPIITMIVMLSFPLVNLWLADKFNSQWEHANSHIATMVIILLLGNTFFVVAQGMLRIMLGAGDVHHYAHRLLQAGIVQTVLALVVLVIATRQFGTDTSESKAAVLYAVSGCMSLIQILAYGLYLPLLACRLYHLRRRAMYLTSFGPGILVSLATALTIVICQRFLIGDSGWAVLITLGVSGCVTAPIALFAVLTAQERSRILVAFGLRRG